jgi:hypothetical protein
MNAVGQKWRVWLLAGLFATGVGALVSCSHTNNLASAQPPPGTRGAPCTSDSQCNSFHCANFHCERREP